jgi:hypothetical protein
MKEEEVPSLKQQMQQRQEQALIAVIVRDALIEAAHEHGGLYVREPFPREGELADIFLMWLTPSEFLTVWALTFSWLDVGQLKALPVGEAMRAVIVRLEHEYGYDWKGLDSTPEGDLFAYERKPISPGNANWIAMLGVYNKPPDYFSAFKRAIHFCEMDHRLSELLPLLKDTEKNIHAAKDRLELTDEEKKVYAAMAEFQRDLEASNLPPETVAQLLEDIQ